MRRFEGDKCTGVWTKAMIKKFWGDAVEHLVMAARIIHWRKQVIYAERKKNRLLPHEVQYELGVVSYPGSGKYRKFQKCHFVAWEDIPDNEENSSFDFHTSPPGQGWWPVIAIDLLPQPMGYKATGTVLMMCFYQLQGDDLIAWWIWPNVGSAPVGRPWSYQP